MPTGSPINSELDPDTGLVIPPGIDVIFPLGVFSRGWSFLPVNFSFPQAGAWMLLIQATAANQVAGADRYIDFQLDPLGSSDVGLSNSVMFSPPVGVHVTFPFSTMLITVEHKLEIYSFTSTPRSDLVQDADDFVNAVAIRTARTP